MQIRSFFRGFARDIEALVANKTPTEKRNEMILSVAFRSLAIFGAALATAALVVGVVLLTAGSLGGIIPIIMSIAVAVFAHDAAVIGHNWGQMHNPELSFESATLAVRAAGEALGSDESFDTHFMYQNTWVLRHFV